VERAELINRCTEHILGNPDKGGHYFTIWGPRQSGKTWMMRQVVMEIEARYGDRLLCTTLSMQGVIMKDDEPEENFLHHVPRLLDNGFGILNWSQPANWDEWSYLFKKTSGPFERPVILFIDEFDSLPMQVIDRLVTLFRDMYLDRKNYLLHGLALIGVRAVLGVSSHRGSPFNVQRALHVPNLTKEETEELFRQYQEESGQRIETEVVEKVYQKTNGQPGLVSWFGELLTEKYNPGQGETIGNLTWKLVWQKARFTEPNNTVMNLIAKARMPEYRDILMAVFSQSDIPFAFHDPVCNYLYLNGIIEPYTVEDDKGEPNDFCRFSSPFIQDCIYSALGMEMVRTMPVRALEPLDDLSDVLDQAELNLPALLDRYREYLKRLKAAGFEIWENQPPRADLRMREAVGHFHLYAWLCDAIGRHCTITPEFPVGNGQVDIHIRCGSKRGIIEIKSFSDVRQIKKAKKRSADYAKSLGLDAVTVAVFISGASEEALGKISSEEVIDGVKVSVKAMGI
jgi:hypothetical protein